MANRIQKALPKEGSKAEEAKESPAVEKKEQRAAAKKSASKKKGY